MNDNDEAELHKLTHLLAEISQKTALTDNEGEALKKAGVALSVAFIHGLREEIAILYQGIDKSLNNNQRHNMRSLSIEKE